VSTTSLTSRTLTAMSNAKNSRKSLSHSLTDSPWSAKKLLSYPSLTSLISIQLSSSVIAPVLPLSPPSLRKFSRSKSFSEPAKPLSASLKEPPCKLLCSAPLSLLEASALKITTLFPSVLPTTSLTNLKPRRPWSSSPSDQTSPSPRVSLSRTSSET